MTPEQESTVFQDLGSIKAGIVNLNTLLEAHTSQDMTQFAAMTDTVKEISVKVDKIITDMAVDTALKTQHEQFIRKIATSRAAIVAVCCSAFGTLFQTFGYAIWQHFFG